MHIFPIILDVFIELVILKKDWVKGDWLFWREREKIANAGLECNRRREFWGCMVGMLLEMAQLALSLN